MLKCHYSCRPPHSEIASSQAETFKRQLLPRTGIGGNFLRFQLLSRHGNVAVSFENEEEQAHSCLLMLTFQVRIGVTIHARGVLNLLRQLPSTDVCSTRRLRFSRILPLLLELRVGKMTYGEYLACVPDLETRDLCPFLSHGLDKMPLCRERNGVWF